MTPAEARAYVEAIWPSIEREPVPTGGGKRYKCVEDAVRVVLLGDDLGIPPGVALEQIHLISGRPSPGRPIKHGLVMRAGVLTELDAVWSEEEYGWEVSACREGKLTHKETATWAEVEASGIPYNKSGSLKSVWENHCKRMLLWTALDNLHDVLCPDITGGLVTPDEQGVEEPLPEMAPEGVKILDWEARYESIWESLVKVGKDPMMCLAQHGILEITQENLPTVVEHLEHEIPF